MTIDTASVKCLISSAETITTLPQDEPSEKLDEEFILFVATVYGEACGQSEAAWKAVASVIMNRVGNKRFLYGPKGHKKIPVTVQKVIETGGFDAYQDKTIQFSKAKKLLKEGSPSPRIRQLIKSIKPIYDKKETVTTDAVMYYSPKTQHQLHLKVPEKYDETPGWHFDEIQSVTIPGMNISDDFLFYRYKRKHEAN